MLLSLRSVLEITHREDLSKSRLPGISVYFFHDHPAHVMGLPGVLNVRDVPGALALGLA